MPARTITIAGLGDFRQLQSELERTGLIGDKSATTMANSAKRAGLAAAEQAKLVGQSADQQAAAAGRAAAAYEKSQERMSQAAKAASRSAAEAGRAAGLSADQQEAAAKRAAAAQDTHAKISKVGGVVALGAAGLAVEAVKLGMAYQTAQASIQGATGQSVKSTGELTKAFGATAGSSMESGQQMETAYAGVAGQLKLTEGHALSTAEAMKFSAAANNLAEGTGTDLASAYSATAKVLQTFHMDASQAGQVTDTLYSTSKALAVPVEQVATAVSKLHARLGEAAPSLGDTAGLMVALGEHGMTGSRGIMVVNTAFQTLLGGSKKTDDVLKAIGVSVYDSSGKFVGLQSVISQLQPKLAGMTEQQRRFTEATLFGKGAAEVLGQVIRAGAPAFDQATAAATRHNAALKAAEAQQKTFKGEMQTLKATVETLGGDIGLILIPDLQKVATVLMDGIQWLEKHKAACIALGAVITGVLGTAVAIFAYDKAVAFGKGVQRMTEGLKSLVTSSSTSAASVEADQAAQAAAVEANAAKIQAANAETDASFAELGPAAASGTAAVEGAVVGEAGAVTTTDATIEADNVAAGASFTALLGPIGVAVAAVVAAEPIINKLTGGGLGENPASEKSTIGAANKAASQQDLNIGGGIMAFYEAKGLSPAQAAGIVGNVQQESSFDPNAAGGGLFQDEGGRGTKPGASVKAQIEQAWKEMQVPGSKEHAALEELKKAKTPQEAARAFSGSAASGKGFERPGTPEIAKREKYAAEALAAHPKKGSTPSSSSLSKSQIEQAAGGDAALQQAMEEQAGLKPKKKGPEAEKEYLGANNQIVDETAKQHAHKALLEKKAKAEGKETTAAMGIPAGVVTMLKTAEALIGAPYKSGGGHGSSADDPIAMLKQIGIDCSGFVSKVLSSGGVPGVAGLTTQGLSKNLAKGPGKYVTVEDRPEGSQAHTIIDVLGKWFESGGKLGGGVKALTKAQAGQELAGGGFQAFHPADLNAAVKGGVSATGLKQITAAGEANEKAVKALGEAAKKMLGETTPRGNLESAIQSGTVSTLEKVLGVSTGGKAGSTLPRELARSSGQELTSASLHTIVATLSRGAQGTPTGKTFDKMITELNATHQAGMVKLAARLERAHKEALDDLGRELYAVTQEKQAAMLSNQATELKDRTTQEADYASRQLDIVKATNQQELDAMQSATKQIEDTTVVMRDAFAAAGEAISMQSQLGTEEASGQVMEIKDAATIQVAKLGERGLYGLNLIAQKQEVQLDEMKASYDIEIEHAKIAADHVKIAQAQLLAAKQQEVDLLQAHEDQIAAAEQAQADSVAVQDAINLSTKQATEDQVQLSTDGAVDAALIASVIAATKPKAQQDAAKGFEAELKGKQAFNVAEAADSLSKAQSAANTAAENAAHAYATAQAEGAQVIASAQEGLEKVKGEGEIAVKNAEAAVSSIEAKAAVAEANLEGKIAVERERAQTQYAGSGLSIEMYGMDYGNAEANVNALTWALTHQLPV